MERMQQRIRQITGGDQAKLARLKEILTWFDNEWEISRTVRAMWQCMRTEQGGDDGCCYRERSRVSGGRRKKIRRREEQGNGGLDLDGGARTCRWEPV